MAKVLEQCMTEVEELATSFLDLLEWCQTIPRQASAGSWGGNRGSCLWVERVADG